MKRHGHFAAGAQSLLQIPTAAGAALFWAPFRTPKDGLIRPQKKEEISRNFARGHCIFPS